MALLISVALTGLLVSPVFALAGWLKPAQNRLYSARRRFNNIR